MHPRLLIAATLLVVGYIATLAAPELGLSLSIGLGLAAATVASFGWFIVEEIGYIRRLDELHRRIQLEALAIAFPLSILLIVALGLVERLHPLPADDLSFRHVWPFFIAFYCAGLVIARRRYR